MSQRFVRCGPNTVRRRVGWVMLAIQEDGHNNPHWWLPATTKKQAIRYAKDYRRKGCWTHLARTHLQWPMRIPRKER